MGFELRARDLQVQLLSVGGPLHAMAVNRCQHQAALVSSRAFAHAVTARRARCPCYREIDDVTVLRGRHRQLGVGLVGEVTERDMAPGGRVEAHVHRTVATGQVVTQVNSADRLARFFDTASRDDRRESQILGHRALRGPPKSRAEGERFFPPTDETLMIVPLRFARKSGPWAAGG